MSGSPTPNEMRLRREVARLLARMHDDAGINWSAIAQMLGIERSRLFAYGSRTRAMPRHHMLRLVMVVRDILGTKRDQTNGRSSK